MSDFRTMIGCISPFSAIDCRALGGAPRMDFRETLDWMTRLYDGYHFYPHCEGVFNPFSVLNACKARTLDNF